MTYIEHQTVGICIVTHDNFHETKFFVENLLKSTTFKFRLYIFDYGSGDERIIEYCQALCVQTKGYFRALSDSTHVCNIYNQFLQCVTEKYICFVPINAVLSTNWLKELVDNYLLIQNSGCIGVRCTQDEAFLVGQLHEMAHKSEDEIKTVWSNKMQVVDTVMFFDKDRLGVVGSFDERLTDCYGFEKQEFSFRFLGNGFKNYFIKNATYIKLPINDPILFPLLTKSAMKKFKEHIDLMFKVRQFKK